MIPNKQNKKSRKQSNTLGITILAWNTTENTPLNKKKPETKMSRKDKFMDNQIVNCCCRYTLTSSNNFLTPLVVTAAAA